jgi:hypothetical protein
MTFHINVDGGLAATSFNTPHPSDTPASLSLSAVSDRSARNTRSAPFSLSTATTAASASIVVLLLLGATQALSATVGAPSCGSIVNEVFADMHDGDQKNVTLTEAGLLTLSQAATAAQPIAWALTTLIDLTTCVAEVDFSKSKKPAHPPVPLNARVLQSTVGTLLLEFTDPSDPKVRKPGKTLNRAPVLDALAFRAHRAPVSYRTFCPPQPSHTLPLTLW